MSSGRRNERLSLISLDAGKGGPDLLLKTGDQFAVGGYQRLFGFDLDDHGLLRGEGWDRDFDGLENLDVDVLLGC